MTPHALSSPAVLCGVAAILIVQDRAPFADAAARTLVERSRAAIVTSGGLRDLGSLELRGRVRVPQEGSRFDEGEVHIKILLPGQFVRVDTVGGVTTVSRDGGQFARLMLGATTYLVPDQKLTVRSTGEEAFEDTEAVDVSGPSLSVRLVFDRASMIPLRLTYFASGRASTVMSFADRRPVGAFVLPFRVTLQIPQRVLETLMFDDVRVNPPLTKDDFPR